MSEDILRGKESDLDLSRNRKEAISRLSSRSDNEGAWYRFTKEASRILRLTPETVREIKSAKVSRG